MPRPPFPATGSNWNDWSEQGLDYPGLIVGGTLKQVFQPAEGQQDTDGGAEIGKEEDQQDSGHAVAPPAAHSGDVVPGAFHVADLGGDQKRLDQAGDEANPDGRV